jgi:hypothetical protein
LRQKALDRSRAFTIERLAEQTITAYHVASRHFSSRAGPRT